MIARLLNMLGVLISRLGLILLTIAFFLVEGLGRFFCWVGLHDLGDESNYPYHHKCLNCGEDIYDH